MADKVDLEYINCELCGEKNSKNLFSFPPFHYVQCENCNLVYLNPRPNCDFINRLYRDCQYDYLDSDIKKDITVEKELYFFRFSDRLKEIGTFKKKGRILDVGCAWGYFLFLAKKDGWDIYGTELSLVEAQYAQREFSLNVFRGSLKDAKFPSRFFDVITLWHVLEHIPHPLEEMSEIRRILKEGGLLAIETPKITRLQDDAREHGSIFSTLIHLFYYNNETLNLLMEKAGFKIVRIRECGDSEAIKKIANLRINFIKDFIIKYFRYLKWIKRFFQWIRGILKMHKNIIVYAQPLQ